MTPFPLLSVVVPAHQACHLVPDTLGALARSTLPRISWELIVVDDASTDGTLEAAQPFADQTLRLEGSPRGPGAARNAGAALARGAWLVFVDADVRVHADTLERFTAAIRSHPEADAIFGAYDDQPEAQGLVSQYRNLLHRYVHLRGAGEAATFWAGCGAVRRTLFDTLGGFDTTRFPRPQIEDIELGYRIRDRGGRILLDPTIQGTHLKRWTLATMLRTDIRDRGIPWMQLLLERRGRTPPSLNAGRSEQAKVGLTGLGLAVLPVAAALANPPLLLAGSGLLAAVVIANWPVHHWYSQVRGPGFAVATIPLLLVYYASSAIAGAMGVLVHTWSGLARRARGTA